MLELFDGFGPQSYQDFLRSAIILYYLGVKRTSETYTTSEVGANVRLFQSRCEYSITISLSIIPPVVKMIEARGSVSHLHSSPDAILAILVNFIF